MLQKRVFHQKNLFASSYIAQQQNVSYRLFQVFNKRCFRDSPAGNWSDFGAEYDKIAALVSLYYSKIAASLLFPSEKMFNRAYPIQLLDIAGGPGTFVAATHSHFHHSSLLFPPNSTITSTDDAAGMVSFAQKNIGHLNWNLIGNPTINYLEVDACDPHSIPDHQFTHLSCMFGIMFFPARSESLLRLREKLLPQVGRAVFSTWHTTPFKDLCDEFSCHIESHVTDTFFRPFPLDICKDPILFQQELLDAGYQNIQITQHEETFEMTEESLFHLIVKNPIFTEAFPILSSKSIEELRRLWLSYIQGAGKKWVKVLPSTTTTSTGTQVVPAVLRLKHIANIASASS